MTAATATATAPPEGLLGESGPIPLGEIEAELLRRLKGLRGAEGPVQRAHMSNLVISCDSDEAAQAAAAQIPEIVALHPARVILAVGLPGEPSAGAAATVHIRALATGGPRVFAEQVTLRARGRGLNQLPFAIRELLIGDLPTNLWWASHVPPPLAGTLLFDLSEQAQQVVFDSLGWLDPNRGVAATSSWLGHFEHRPGARWRVASDLNWRRTRTWRRVLAQALDPATAPGAMASITEVSMEHGPHAVTQAWQLMSWLASRLGWTVQAGRVQGHQELSWQAQARHGALRLRIRRLNEGPPEVRRVRVACLLCDKPGHLDVTSEANRISVQLEGCDLAPRTVTDPPLRPAELLARQLSDRERDPIFEEAMAVAQVLARSALHC